MTEYYVDLNFKSRSLKLDASRKLFIQNESYYKIKNNLELLILRHLENFIQSFSFENMSDKVEYTNRIFKDYISTYAIDGAINRNEPIDNVMEFFQEHYLFPSVIQNKFTFATAKELTKRACALYLFLYDISCPAIDAF
jgi:hypothetical protein